MDTNVQNLETPVPPCRFLVYTLWVLQVLLGALFIFAGGMKLVMTMEQMKGPVALPELLLRFIGVIELLGGLGLLLPGITRIATYLTPLAAMGLIIIMIGAVVISIMGKMYMGALFPLVVGLLLVFVTYGRWKLAPHRKR